MQEIFIANLLLYKYAVIFVFCFAATFGLPIPITATLMASGAFVVRGYLGLPWVLLFSFLGNILGDCTVYTLSSLYGQRAIKFIGLGRLLESSAFKKFKRGFKHRSIFYIFLSRFLVPSVGPLINIISGLANFPFKKFLFLELAGEMIYVLLFVGIGFAFASTLGGLSVTIGSLSLAFTIIFLLMMIIGAYLQKAED